jgi:hypothetical protein
MMYLRPWMLFAPAAVPTACHCENASYVDTDQVATDSEVPTSTSSWGASGVLTGSSTEESTGAPFDASRWIGRYHYENPLAEWGDPYATYMLVNLEIFEDSTAIMFYDHCTFDPPEIIVYEWAPDDEPGWLELHPGTGESSLRFLSSENLETLRVQLIEPCRGLQFEADGVVDGWTPFYRGESCWIDRCGDGISLVVGYCEGEEPPPCP